MYTLWKSTIEDNKTALDEDWSNQTGCDSAIDYLKSNNMLDIAPGDSYVIPEEDSMITTLRSQCGASLTEYSWKMVFADDEKSFDSLFKELQKTLTGLDYDTLFTNDKEQAEAKTQARKDVVTQYGKNNK